MRRSVCGECGGGCYRLRRWHHSPAVMVATLLGELVSDDPEVGHAPVPVLEHGDRFLLAAGEHGDERERDEEPDGE